MKRPKRPMSVLVCLIIVLSLGFTLGYSVLASEAPIVEPETISEPGVSEILEDLDNSYSTESTNSSSSVPDSLPDLLEKAEEPLAATESLPEASEPPATPIVPTEEEEVVPTAEGDLGEVITFPDPAFEAAVREIIQKPTGDIYISDVAYIEELNISNKGLVNLSGIEYFSSLEVLICSNNELTSLYLPDFMESVLKELDVSNNPLTSCNFTSIPSLIRVDISGTALRLFGRWSGFFNLRDIKFPGGEHFAFRDPHEMSPFQYIDFDTKEIVFRLHVVEGIGWEFVGVDTPPESIPAPGEGGYKEFSVTLLPNQSITVTHITMDMVTFQDWDGRVIQAGRFPYKTAATPPADPVRPGYDFIGWDGDFSYVVPDLEVTALYRVKSADDIGDDLDGMTEDEVSDVEDDYIEENNIVVNIEVANNTHGDFHNGIKAIGIGFNAQPGEEATLRFTKPEKDVAVDPKYNRNSAVQVDISLNGYEGKQLMVPITITVPIPSGIKPEEFWILHHHKDGTVETISPVLNGDGTCTFTVTSFSVFSFVNIAEAADVTPPVTPTTPETPVVVPEVPAVTGFIAPQTGDSSSLLALVVTFVCAGIIATSSIVYYRRRPLK